MDVEKEDFLVLLLSYYFSAAVVAMGADSDLAAVDAAAMTAVV